MTFRNWLLLLMVVLSIYSLVFSEPISLLVGLIIGFLVIAIEKDKT